MCFPVLLSLRRHTHILDEGLASSNDSRLIGDASLAVLEGLLGGRIVEANSVVVADASRLGNHDLDILNGGVGAELDRSWELLDGLLRSLGVSVF